MSGTNEKFNLEIESCRGYVNDWCQGGSEDDCFNLQVAWYQASKAFISFLEKQDQGGRVVRANWVCWLIGSIDVGWKRHRILRWDHIEHMGEEDEGVATSLFSHSTANSTYQRNWIDSVRCHLELVEQYGVHSRRNNLPIGSTHFLLGNDEESIRSL